MRIVLTAAHVVMIIMLEERLTFSELSSSVDSDSGCSLGSLVRLEVALVRCGIRLSAGGKVRSVFPGQPHSMRMHLQLLSSEQSSVRCFPPSPLRL